MRERPYDLVICDLKMPRLDGIVVLPRHCGDDARAGRAPDLRDRRCRRHRRRALSRGERLSLAGEAVPARRSCCAPRATCSRKESPRLQALAARVGSAAFIIAGFCRNCSTVERIIDAACGRRHRAAERVAEPADGARVQLATRDSFTPISCADLLHRHFAVVVEANHLPLAPGQRLDRLAHAIPHFRASRRRCPAAPALTAPAPPAASSRRCCRRWRAATWTRWC